MFDELKARFAKLKSHAANWAEEEIRCEARVKDLQLESEEISHAIRILNQLHHDIHEDSAKKTVDLCTLALQESFPDDDLSLVLEQVEQYNHPGIELYIKDEMRKGALQDPQDAGGRSSLLSFLLRVITILRQKKLGRILLLDETFPAVSKEYRETVGKLVKRFCREFGFQILLVTHEQAMAGCADVHYECYSDEDGYFRMERK